METGPTPGPDRCQRKYPADVLILRLPDCCRPRFSRAWNGSRRTKPSSLPPASRCCKLTRGDTAIDLVNAYAPEHLQLMVADPQALPSSACVTPALSSSGLTSGTAFGDYVAGSNHILPTGGRGRFSSGLATERVPAHPGGGRQPRRRRRGPGRTAGRSGPRRGTARTSAERAWAGSPSARARSASGAARRSTAAAGISTTSWMRRNTLVARPDEKRPRPPVGRMWFEPAT